MAKSVFKSFVGGVRAVLGLQFVLALGGAGVAGYAMLVTSEVMRERDAALADNAALSAYIEDLTGAPPPADIGPPRIIEEAPPAATEPTPADPAQPAPEPADGATPPAADPQPPAADPASPPERADNPNLGGIFDAILPPPPITTLVLNVRSEADARYAGLLVESLQTRDMKVSVEILSPNNTRNSGYAFFDPRQARAAGALARRVQTVAQERQLTAWTVSLNGVAEQATGAYTPDRVDIVLPPLTAQPVRPELRLRRQRPILEQAPPQQPVIQ